MPLYGLRRDVFTDTEFRVNTSFFLSMGDVITGFGFCGSDEKSSVIEVVFPLYVIYCFPLAASNIVFFPNFSSLRHIWLRFSLNLFLLRLNFLTL